MVNLRALSFVGGNALEIANAVRYAAGLENDSNVLPRKKADIINLSLSGTCDSRVLKAAIQAARAEGTIVIAAAGHSGQFSSVLSGCLRRGDRCVGGRWRV